MHGHMNVKFRILSLRLTSTSGGPCILFLPDIYLKKHVNKSDKTVSFNKCLYGDH